jgi:hypothetical protein
LRIFEKKMGLTFCAFGKNAVPLEEHEAERFVLVGFLVDRPDDFFYFSKLLEIR